MGEIILEKDPVRFRHELKQMINRGDDHILASRLRHIFRRDGNSGADGTYKVTSLYFDTPEDLALRQKTDGTDRREKFRLRYYGNDMSFIRLEKKIKINGLCAKYAARLTCGQAAMILEGDHGFLLRSGDPLMMEFYSKIRGQRLRPAAMVVYDREAFVFGPANVRVTLDRNIRAGYSPEAFLNGGPSLPADDTGLTVLEIKYDEFLPDIVRMAVHVPGRKTQSYSKYAACRKYR